MTRHVLRAVLTATLLGGLLAPAAHAAPKRIVALEWDIVENLRALGIKPVGAADLAGYRTYVSIGLPSGITDVGRRQEPSIERIAKLKPDLIVVPNYRAGSSLSTLRKISKVLVTNPYPGDTSDGAQFGAMVKDFRALAKAVGKPKGGEAVLRNMTRTFSELRKRIGKAKRGGTRVTVATPGGTSSSPAVRLFTNNSASAEIVRRLGLRNAWTSSPGRYGFSIAGVEALRKVQSGWLAFVYPGELAGQIKRFTGQSSYKRLTFVKRKHVRNLQGNTWLFGGPLSSKVFAQRLTAALT